MTTEDMPAGAGAAIGTAQAGTQRAAAAQELWDAFDGLERLIRRRCGVGSYRGVALHALDVARRWAIRDVTGHR